MQEIDLVVQEKLHGMAFCHQICLLEILFSPFYLPISSSSLRLTAHTSASMPEAFLQGLALGLEGRTCVNQHLNKLLCLKSVSGITGIGVGDSSLE